MAPLTLKKSNSNFLDSHILYELVPLRTLHAVLASGKLLSNWDRTNYAIEKTKRLYANERKQVEDYLAKYDNSIGGVPVEYKKAKHGYGRNYATKSLCLSNMYRSTRHALANETFYDIDIKNCQVEIVRQVAKSNGIVYPSCLDEYCNDREAVLKDHMEYCNMGKENRWLVKTLFLRLIFCGSWKGFYISCKEEHNMKIPENPTKFVYEFKKGLEQVGKQLADKNPELYRVATNNKERKEAQTPVLASFLSLYLQDYENKIIATVLNTINEKTDIMKVNGKLVGSYEYDGFKLSKEKVDSFSYKQSTGKEAVCKLAQDTVKKAFDLDLAFEEKVMDEGFDISHVTEEQIAEVAQKLKTVEVKNDDAAKYVLSLNDTKLCRIVREDTDNSFIFLMPDKKWMTWDGQRWKPDDVALWKCIPDVIDKHVRNMFKDDWSQANEAALIAYLNKLQNYKAMNNVVKLAEKLFADYETKFDMNTDLIGFANGVWDIAQGCFRPADKDDLVTMSCGYAFSTESENEEEYMTDVKRVLDQIHPVKENRELFMMILASGLSGRAIEHFFVYNGGGRNGKGLINQAMRLLLGNYYCDANISIVTESSQFKRSGGPNPEKAKLDKARYIVMKEPDASTPIQNNTVKDLTGGGTIQARTCFSNSTDCELHGTFCVEANKRPPIAEEAQDADMDRWVDYLFQSHFTANEAKWNSEKFIYPIDPNLKKREWWITRRMAFMKILLGYLNVLHMRNYILQDIIPDAIKRRTQDYLQGSYLIHRLFLQTFEERRDDVDYGKLDKDFTIPQIAQEIMAGLAFSRIPWKERQKVTMKEIKAYFHQADYFQEGIYKKGNSLLLRGYRLTHEDDATDPEVEESSDGDFGFESEED